MLRNLLAQKKKRKEDERESKRDRKKEREASSIMVDCCSGAPLLGLAVVMGHFHWDWMLH